MNTHEITRKTAIELFKNRANTLTYQELLDLTKENIELSCKDLSNEDLEIQLNITYKPKKYVITSN